jgi:bacterioferritin
MVTGSGLDLSTRAVVERLAGQALEESASFARVKRTAEIAGNDFFKGGKTAMATNHDIINELRKSYAMELETVENYLANSIDLDGVRAEEIKKALLRDIEEELGHARKLGNRIKVLEGRVPGSLDLDRGQHYLKPPNDSTDVIAVIRGVIRAEEEAIDQYKKIIKMCDPIDLVTQDLILEITGEEQAHRRLFIGFLYEYESGEAKRLSAAAA